ncbi:hypothetical protein ACFMPD_00645 [Sedimentitalea sp. HM32M-2]|uniref:hypothetical protein n=1 Tax=Sedimentitalea sp. HM32M-2 TaxID=3351566 RepID=UPI0036437B6A
MKIVQALKVKLSPSERQGIASVGTTDLEAHQNFMRMRSYLFYPGMDAQHWRQAIQFGERAIQQDPNYAQAHAVLSLMHLLDFHNGWSGDDSAVAMEKAKNLSDQAYALGPD